MFAGARKALCVKRIGAGWRRISEVGTSAIVCRSAAERHALSRSLWARAMVFGPAGKTSAHWPVGFPVRRGSGPGGAGARSARGFGYEAPVPRLLKTKQQEPHLLIEEDLRWPVEVSGHARQTKSCPPARRAAAQPKPAAICRCHQQLSVGRAAVVLLFIGRPEMVGSVGDSPE